MKKNSIFVWSVDLFKPRSELGPRPIPGPNRWKICKVTWNSRIILYLLYLSSWPNNLHKSKSKILVSS